MTKQNLPRHHDHPKQMSTRKKPLKLFPFMISFLIMMLGSFSSFAHVWEIRVNQAQDGTLTWYLQSYHSPNETACATNYPQSGLTINGVNYPIQSIANGSIETLSPTIFARNTSCGTQRLIYGIIRTPFLGTTLSVSPYSNVACWDNCNINAVGSFTPPPPPVCTACPLAGWSNTLAASGNNNGTPCNLQDDHTTATIKVAHLACANITGDKQFRVIFDPAGANVAYGPYNYNAGVETQVTINIPSGTSSSIQVKVIDDDFPCEVTHGLTLSGGTYSGEKETVPPTISCPTDITAGTNAGSCNAKVEYALPSFSDNCGTANMEQTGGLPSGSIFPIGETINTFKVTDASGNVATCSFTVTVTDDDAPTAICKNIDIPLGESLTASITAADINNGSKDNCSSVTTKILSGKTSYNCDDVGETYDVTLEVTDAKGLTSTCVAKVTVTDPNSYCNVAPVAVCKSLTVSANDNCQGIASAEDFDGGSSDADGDNMTFTVAPAGPYAIGTTTVTLTVTDPDGASSSCTSTITVVDDKTPTITAPLPVTVQTSNDGRGNCSTTALLGTPVTSDNCTVALVVATVDGAVINPDTHEFTRGETTVTWTVTDAAGNSASATQVVTVVDDEVPTITCTPVYNFCFGEEQTIPVPAILDNCGADLSSIRSDGQPLNAPYLPGTTTINWTVTDATGNSASCQTIVNVNPEITVSIADVKALEYTGLDKNTVYLGYAPASSVTLAATAAGGDENYRYSWSPVSGSNSSIIVSPTNLGGNEFTVRVNDGFDNGRCYAEQSITLVVKDARCGSDNTKVNMCHVANSNDPTHTKTICIDGGSVLDHLKKGCRLNDCLNEGTITTGVATEVMAAGFAIKAMPNPSTSYFTLKVETSNLTDRVVLRVMDIKGRLVEMKQNVQPNQALRIGDQYRPGIYFIEVMQGAERTQTKIIKMSN